jgi:histidyl-tRNA synthetase
VFLVGLGDDAVRANLLFASRLRKAGIPSIAECESRSMKAQMRAADRMRSAWVLIRGENELAGGIVVCKEMTSGEQTVLDLDHAVDFIREKLL